MQVSLVSLYKLEWSWLIGFMEMKAAWLICIMGYSSSQIQQAVNKTFWRLFHLVQELVCLGVVVWMKMAATGSIGSQNVALLGGVALCNRRGHVGGSVFLR